MKFKEGDTVRVKNLKVGDSPLFVYAMEEYCGKIVTITCVCENHYYIKEDSGFIWTEEMFEEDNDIILSDEECNSLFQYFNYLRLNNRI